MDLQGFEAINRVLDNAEAYAVVTPEPAEGEHVRFVTIETDEDVSPATVLNALGKAGMICSDQLEYTLVRNLPELSPLGVQRGSLTFEDKNTSPSF